MPYFLNTSTKGCCQSEAESIVINNLNYNDSQFKYYDVKNKIYLKYLIKIIQYIYAKLKNDV